MSKIITNRLNLPQILVNAVSRDDHRSADFSVTQIIDPPKIALLKKRHADEITIDVADRLDILRGQALHAVIEKGAGITDMVETYIVATPRGNSARRKS